MASTIRFALAALALLGSTADALNPIKVESQNFVDTVSGKRFDILGVDYQPGASSGFDPASGIDPLTDVDQCIRDAALMQAIGFNTIRIYNIDPNLNHDECMSVWNYVGIYLVLDVNSPLPGGSISQLAPASSYNAKYLKRIFQMVDSFSGYPNVIGLFGANELINSWSTANLDGVYIRAVTRDLKAYIDKQAQRKLPVGYSAADFRPALVDTTNYLQCEVSGQPDSRSDFFALNSYSWCGPDATYQSSQYDVLARDFSKVTMPSFFSEYGCIVPPPRYFNEVPVLYGPKMTALSGGLVYQWTTEEGNEGYGLIDVQNNGNVEFSVDLENLIGQYSKLNINLLENRNATASSLTPPTCSSSLISGPWQASFDLPAAPEGSEDLIQNGAGGRVGKLVPVTKTTVDVVVTYANGATTRGLTITRAQSANIPDSTPKLSVGPVPTKSSKPAGPSTESNPGPGPSTSGQPNPSPSSSSGSNPSPSQTAGDNAAPGMVRSASGNPAPYVGVSLASLILWLLG